MAKELTCGQLAKQAHRLLLELGRRNWIRIKDGRWSSADPASVDQLGRRQAHPCGGFSRSGRDPAPNKKGPSVDPHEPRVSGSATNPWKRHPRVCGDRIYLVLEGLQPLGRAGTRRLLRPEDAKSPEIGIVDDRLGHGFNAAGSNTPSPGETRTGLLQGPTRNAGNKEPTISGRYETDVPLRPPRCDCRPHGHLAGRSRGLCTA